MGGASSLGFRDEFAHSRLGRRKAIEENAKRKYWKQERASD